MPGELDMYKNTEQSPVFEKGYPSYEAVNKDKKIVKKNDQLDKAMKAPIDQDRIRKAGW